MSDSTQQLNETMYIYGPAIEWGFRKKMQPRFLSVGMGLGYIEFLVAALCLYDNQPQKKGLSEDVYLESFEADPTLRKSFLDFINGRISPNDTYYHAILKSIEDRMGVDSEDIIQFLSEAYDTESWILRPTLSVETDFASRFDVVLYDLSKTEANETLWSEHFLDKFLNQVTASTCAFATFASKESLQRSLGKLGFNVQDRKGFAGIPQSTLAYRSNFLIN